MADKKYKITFDLSNGSQKSVEFTSPQGEQGKSAYEYALDGGYTGTEADFATKMATGYDTVETVTETETLAHDGYIADADAGWMNTDDLTAKPTLQTTVVPLSARKESTLTEGGRLYFNWDVNKVNKFHVRAVMYNSDGEMVKLFCAYNGTDYLPYSTVIGDMDDDVWLDFVGTNCNNIEVTGPFSIPVPADHTVIVLLYMTGANLVMPDGTVTKTWTSGIAEDAWLYTWMKEGVEVTLVTETTTGSAASGSANSVRYTEQVLSAEQKAQARENIGAVSISEVVSTVNAGGRAVPDYWQDAVEDVIETVKEKQNEGGHNCVSFAFFSDSHITTADTLDAGFTGVLAKSVMDACDIPYAIACGDNTDDCTDGSTENITNVRAAFARTRENYAAIGWDRLLHTIGNHDGCWGTNESLSDPYYCYQLDANEIYNHVYRKHKDVAGIVFGGDRSHYYVDDVASKTRFIVLNSHWVTDSYTDDSVAVNRRMRTFGFGQDQLSWLAEDALSFSEDGWGVVVAFHVPIYCTDITYRDREVIIGILDSYINGTSGTFSYGSSGEWDAVSVTVDYTADEHRAEVIGVFNGHTHNDAIDTETYSFPTVSIICDSGATVQNPNYTGTREFGTDTEHAIDFVTINRTSKKVSLTRLGAGYERSREYYYG